MDKVSIQYLSLLLFEREAIGMENGMTRRLMSLQSGRSWRRENSRRQRRRRRSIPTRTFTLIKRPEHHVFRLLALVRPLDGLLQVHDCVLHLASVATLHSKRSGLVGQGFRKFDRNVAGITSRSGSTNNLSE